LCGDAYYLILVMLTPRYVGSPVAVVEAVSNVFGGLFQVLDVYFGDGFPVGESVMDRSAVINYSLASPILTD